MQVRSKFRNQSYQFNVVNRHHQLGTIDLQSGPVALPANQHPGKPPTPVNHRPKPSLDGLSGKAVKRRRLHELAVHARRRDLKVVVTLDRILNVQQTADLPAYRFTVLDTNPFGPIAIQAENAASSGKAGFQLGQGRAVRMPYPPPPIPATS